MIKKILKKYGKINTNLASGAAQDQITQELMEMFKEVRDQISKLSGSMNKLWEAEDILEEENIRKTWVCSICNKNTYDVDWDYIGANTNHLGCELESKQLSLFKV